MSKASEWAKTALETKPTMLVRDPLGNVARLAEVMVNQDYQPALRIHFNDIILEQAIGLARWILDTFGEDA